MGPGCRLGYCMPIKNFFDARLCKYFPLDINIRRSNRCHSTLVEKHVTRVVAVTWCYSSATNKHVSSSEGSYIALIGRYVATCVHIRASRCRNLRMT